MFKELKTRAIVAPNPVLIIATYDADGTPDAMNVAWGGQCWGNEIAINISANHKTTENLRLQKAFTLCVPSVERVELADYLGITSGHDKIKMSRVHATVSKGEVVNAPIIDEFMLAMECEVVSMEDNGFGGVRVVGKVVRTIADDTVITEDGKVDYSRLHPIIFDSELNVYRSVGDPVASAFQIGKELF